MKKIESDKTAVENLINIFEKWPENDLLTLKIILVESLKMDMISEADAYDILEFVNDETEFLESLYS